jgi:hypothetical protein
MAEYRSYNFSNRRSWNNNQSTGSRRQMLDMRRQKYFRMDLDELLEGYKMGDNKTTIAAALLNKMTSRSMEEAFEYLDRIKESGTIDDEKSGRLKGLLQRYSKWR